MFDSHDDLPPPVFIGFFPKKTMEADPLLRALGASKIAAVSTCLSPAPPDWIDAWKHNRHGFYDSEELAASVVPDDDRASYDFYAFELIPIEYADELEPMEIAAAPGAVPDDYEFLGYDVVSRSMSSFFECSLMSCCNGAEKFAVNSHCLIASLRDAFAALRSIGEDDYGYEPGPYYLFGVYRKR